MNRPLRLTIVILWLALGCLAVLADQAIEGVVKDSTGGVIPGVTVVLTHSDTGATRQALSDDNGYYIFTNIRPGTYEVKAELEGFQPVKVTGVKVAIGDKLNQPLTLSVSELTTEVEVKAEVEQVETTTSQLDNVIDEKRITDLPLNGRNPLNLVYLTPGVVAQVDGRGPSANGSRFRGTNYQLDGVDNNDTAVYGNVVETNVDATAEFRVITSNPSAEYGRAGGAIIDVISKSGTNDFHGNAYLFNRSDNLDASTWADNYYGLEKGEFKRNQFGGSIGGPILKDKLFFFFNTEFTRIRNAGAVTAVVPTQAFRDTITNPQMAQIFQQYYPLPNAGNPSIFDGNGVAMNGQYAWSEPNPTDVDTYTAKVDYNLNENHSFYARYYYNTNDAPGTRTLPTTDMGMFPFNGHTNSIALNWTWIMSPTMVNDLKIGQNRVVAGWHRPETNAVDLAFSFGFIDPQTYFTDFGGPQALGDQWRATGTFEIKDSLSWNVGAHSVKFGIDFRYMHDNSETNFQIYPVLYFDQYFGVAGPDVLANIAAGQTDYAYQSIYSDGAEFIPGLTDHRGWRSREYDFFVQDDWKLRPNLTLNLGLRYEWKPTPYEVNNLLSNVDNATMIGSGYHLPNQTDFFDPANWSTGSWVDWWYYGAPANWQGTGADIILAEDQPVYKAPKANFAPRIGFSWDPWGDGKTALRGGYGISYDRLFDNLLTWNTAQFPFGTTSLDPTDEAGHSGAWPDASYYGNGTPIPQVTLHLPAESYADQVIYNQDWKQPYIQTWNLSVQRELWPGNILNVTYAGSAGVHLLVRGNPNQMYHPTDELIQQIEDNFGSANAVPTAVWYGLVQNSQWVRIHYIDPSVHSSYHALQTSFSHRFQDGLQFQVNYAWSKALDDGSESVYTEGGSSPFRSDWYNPGYDRGYASFDVRHVFSANFIYELPFGPGKAFGGDMSGVLAALVGGWQVNGIVQANSGYPLDYKVPRDTLGTSNTGSRSPGRPNIVSYDFTTDGNQVGPTDANFNWRNSVNLWNPQGDYYRGAFRGPGFWNVDFSMFKEVRVPWFNSEGAKVQFRAEAFNLFNHTNYTNPVVTLTDANLGKTFAALANRQIQLGLRFIF